MRTELEFYARGKADTTYNLYKGHAGHSDLKNEVSVNSLMLNAYYDFRNDSAFTPWVSAGIGYARIHQESTGSGSWDYGYGERVRYSISRSGPADNFAWSLGAGVRYDVTPDITLDLSYRYLDAGDASVSYKDEWGDKYSKRTARAVLTGMCYSAGSAMRHGSGSLTRLTGQSAMTPSTWRR